MSARAVVHVVCAGEVGGAERMLVDLAAPGASERPHSVALFTPNETLRSLFREADLDVDDRGTAVREGPLPFLASSLGSSDVRWLAGVLERRRAAIVHVHTFASQVLGTRAAERARARIVQTEHSTRVYDDPTCWPFSRWSLARANAVVCISAHVRDVALRKAPDVAARLDVVANGVDTERFAPREPEKAPRSGSLDVVRFIAVGRLDPRKGLDLALHALAHVNGAELWMVGDGEARSELADLASRLGVADRVRFEGYVTDVREALAGADVALSSARTEGLGIAILEAMATGLPVVAVPVGGLVEIVDDGVSGWLASARTVEALAHVMERAMIAGPAERECRGASARARVVEHFSVSAMRAGYERVYARLSP